MSLQLFSREKFCSKRIWKFQNIGKGASMTRQQRRYHQQKLRKLKLVPCDFKMTAAAGLGTILEVFDQTPLAEEFKKMFT